MPQHPLPLISTTRKKGVDYDDILAKICIYYCYTDTYACMGLVTKQYGNSPVIVEILILAMEFLVKRQKPGWELEC